MIDWKSLLTNVKFWIAVIGVVLSVVLYVQGLATVEQIATGLTALAALIIGAITYEQQKAINSIRGMLPPKK